MSDEGAADPGGARDESVRSHRVDRGPGRLIIAVYALFAVAASSRSLVQIATRFDEAPLAYALSAASAVLYVVITGCLLRATSRAVRLASALIVVELVGVVVVGTLSIVDPEAFPDQTVWSSFGAGYLLLPLVLPVVGLLWIRRSGALAVG